MTISISRIYFYAVSLITLVIILIAVFSFIQSLMDYLLPVSYLPEESLESIKTRMASEVYGARTEQEIKDISGTISNEEAEDYRDELEKKELKRMKKEALRRVVLNLIWIAIVFPVYLVHFRIAKRQEGA